MYRKSGEITRFSEIPWGKEIVVTGSVGNGWYWQARGVFIKDNAGCRFRDDCDVYTEFSPKDCISLNVLKEATHAGEGERDGD